MYSKHSTLKFNKRKHARKYRKRTHGHAFKKRRFFGVRPLNVGPEKKFSPVVVQTNQALYSYNSSTGQPWSLIYDPWPLTGTGKQEMIGTNIFIRKLVLNISLVNNKTNGSTAGVRILVLKSNQKLNNFHFIECFNAGATTSTSYPLMFQSYAFGHLIQPRAGMGKVVYDKIIYPKTPTADGTGWGMQDTTYKYKRIVIRINKEYHKDTTDTTRFNHPYYWLFMLDDPNGTTFWGTGMVYNLNYFFTFQDA